MSEHDTLMTLPEVATYTRVSVKRVREWLRMGKLSGVKAGREWRVRRSDLEAFLQVSRPAKEPL